jgi:hypothetical protein
MTKFVAKIVLNLITLDVAVKLEPLFSLTDPTLSSL